MGVSFIRGESSYQGVARPLRSIQRSLADSLIRREYSPANNTTKHVVIVMDGLKAFTTKPLKWALKNITSAGCIVTLLGAMPWLNIPLFSKTWQDVWAVDFQELSTAKEKNEWKTDAKYLKLQAVVNLCKKFGVVVQKEVVMGYPLRLLVVERITGLHATWIVFDRHMKKDSEFFAERIPCNMVLMNENGEEVDMIRAQPITNSANPTPGESPASFIPTPELMIPDNLMELKFFTNKLKNH